jgi:hypothetical protein
VGVGADGGDSVAPQEVGVAGGAEGQASSAGGARPAGSRSGRREWRSADGGWLTCRRRGIAGLRR